MHGHPVIGLRRLPEGCDYGGVGANTQLRRHRIGAQPKPALVDPKERLSRFLVFEDDEISRAVCEGVATAARMRRVLARGLSSMIL